MRRPHDTAIVVPSAGAPNVPCPRASDQRASTTSRLETPEFAARSRSALYGAGRCVAPGAPEACDAEPTARIQRTEPTPSAALLVFARSDSEVTVGDDARSSSKAGVRSALMETTAARGSSSALSGVGCRLCSASPTEASSDGVVLRSTGGATPAPRSGLASRARGRVLVLWERVLPLGRCERASSDRTGVARP